MEVKFNVLKKTTGSEESYLTRDELFGEYYFGEDITKAKQFFPTDILGPVSNWQSYVVDGSDIEYDIKDYINSGSIVEPVSIECMINYTELDCLS